MQKVTPFLWYESQAEEAAKYYTTIFKNSKITEMMRCGDAGPGPKGSVLTIGFEIDGQPVTAINGGPHYKLNPSFSFVVHCDSQEEVDYYWDKLGDGGMPMQCGWLEDKFGLSWQVVPDKMLELLSSSDTEKAGRAMGAMMQMVKLDINKIQAAYDGK